MKTNILIRIGTEKNFLREKGSLFDLYARLNESELQKVKSVQTKLVFLIILVKLFDRKKFINFIQKNSMEK